MNGSKIFYRSIIGIVFVLTMFGCMMLTGCDIIQPSSDSNSIINFEFLYTDAETNQDYYRVTYRDGTNNVVSMKLKPSESTSTYIVSVDLERTEGLKDIYAIKMSDGTKHEFTITNGQKGDNGASIVDVQKVKSEGLVDTYAITMSDGTKHEFTITNGQKGDNGVSIVDVQKVKSEGLVDTYAITMSDGTKHEFTITNGQDGAEGQDLTITEIYEAYKQMYPEEQISFADFLKTYLSFGDFGYEAQINTVSKMLLSSVSIIAEYKAAGYVQQGYELVYKKQTNLMAGSGVIYKMDEDYTYILTNYHVVYASSASEDNEGMKGDTTIASKLVCYLYGSNAPSINNLVYPLLDEHGDRMYYDQEKNYAMYDYSHYGDKYLELEFVGGSATNDIAIARVPTSQILDINSKVQPITFADYYAEGEQVYVVGNRGNMGTSVTQGVVSVMNEFVQLEVGGVSSNHRFIRVDAAASGGNSGGGVFDAKGNLIGLLNAGYTQITVDTNDMAWVNPLQVVKRTAQNIIDYCANSQTETHAYDTSLGIDTMVKNATGQYIDECGLAPAGDVVVEWVYTYTIASTMGIKTGDIIRSIWINEKEYKITQSFDIRDAQLDMRVGDRISVKIERDGQQQTLQQYILTKADLRILA